MMRGENTDSLPTDLIMEIFLRLPAKSITRFRCLSKLWGSMLGRSYFTDLFFTRSSARPPRLLFILKQEGDEWCFFTSPHQNPYEKSSPLVVTADCHMKFHGDKIYREFSGLTSGLILFPRNFYASEEEYVICNPSTGQFGSLHLLPRANRKSYLGFDPIDKQFKVLLISHQSYDEHQILTLGTGNDSWRKIHCPLNHYVHYTKARLFSDCICINGVLYYFAKQTNIGRSLIVCFDVRSEKFKFIHRDFHSGWDSYEKNTKLINYKGKLGVVTLEHTHHYPPDSMRLSLWIMKDVENPESEWSKYICDFYKEDIDGNDSTGWEDNFFGGPLSIVGVTVTGDIVLSMNSTFVPFCLFYINPKTSTLKIVEIQGVGPTSLVEVFIDYVEDLKFIDMMTTYAATTRSPSVREQKRNPTTISKARLQFESTNKFDSLGLLEDDDFI